MRISTGKDAGREYPILGPRFLIGCADHCDLKVNEGRVSPYHCALFIQDGGVWVRDYGNGTIVGGKRILGRRRLNHCDQLQVGSLNFELLIEDALEMGNDQVLDEGEILDIVSQPVSNAQSELSMAPQGAYTAPAEHPEPADTADAAGDSLKKLYMPKGSFQAIAPAAPITAPPTSPPEDDVEAPQSVSATETVIPDMSLSAPRRLVIALTRWVFTADGKLNPNVMFSLGVWVGLGLCTAGLGFLWIFLSLTGGSAPVPD
ncbi:MAG TPA: FHA domain-containing protein [Pirellulales bacterium]|nr:FHA domain-containing protein [Pirellulales bacterium]